MRTCFPLALGLTALLTLPAFASTATARHRSVSHHPRAHLRRAVATHCGEVAGHAGHTRLSSPAGVPCRAPSIHRRARVENVQLRTAALTHPVETLRGHTRARPAFSRIRFVAPLRGSLASLLRQNQRDDAEGLVRIQDDAQLDQMESAGDIVPVPDSVRLRVNPDLPANRRYCRPWTARFLSDLAASHYARFHRPLQVNSAVRTVEFQRHLLEINGNAAPAEGDLASPHLTGAAVDIGKHGMTFSEIAWMRAWLLPLETTGKIDVEEEFYQSCFHITVYRTYQRPGAPQSVARRRRASTTLLAAGVQ